MTGRASAILVFCDFYLPGIKSGGAMRTLENMIQHLGGHFDFRFVTRDRDLHSDEPYTDVRIGDWNPRTSVFVYYAPPRDLGILAIARIMRETAHDLVYLNSFFSFPFTLLPLLCRRFGLAPYRPVLLAPRGELSEGALANKSFGKSMYITIMRILGVYRDICWQASTEMEGAEIRKWFGAKADIRIACDFAAKTSARSLEKRPKIPGEARIVFLSRIDFKKNLGFALDLLARLPASVSMDIYGPVADAPYWAKCQAQIAAMAAGNRIRYLGVVDTRETVGIFSQYDLFLFPTLGENFGHVILESLTAGTPVLISDLTPWKDLEANQVGWSVPLEAPEKFVDILRHVMGMGPEEYGIMNRNAVQYALRVKENPETFEDNLAMFAALLAAAGGKT